MNNSDAAQLHEKWGEKPCTHPMIEAAMEAGQPSTKYVCTTCGKVGEGNQWNTPTEHRSPQERHPMNTQMPDVAEPTTPRPPRPEGPPTPKQDPRPKPKPKQGLPHQLDPTPGSGTGPKE
jgi:hypothetical protein